MTLVTGLTVEAYTISTDAPESDGTLEWQSTTMIVVEISGGGKKGLGYAYGDATVADVITRTLDMTIREGPGGPVGAWPERRYAPSYADAQVSPLTGWSLVAVGALAASCGVVRAASALRRVR